MAPFADRQRRSRKLSEIAASLGSTAVVAVILLVQIGFVLLVAVFVVMAAQDRVEWFVGLIGYLWGLLPSSARGVAVAVIVTAIAGYITLIVIMNVQENRPAPSTRTRSPAQPQRPTVVGPVPSPADPAREHLQVVRENYDDNGSDDGAA